MWTTRRSSLLGSVVPEQWVDFTLICPLFGIRDQSCPHRIIPHVSPFRCVAFVGSNLGIPEFTLPKFCYA